MKILSSLFSAVVVSVVVAFALSNQNAATLALWPFEAMVTLPLYAVGLTALAAGLLIGSVVAGMGSLRLRAELRKVRQECAALQKAAQQDLIAPPTPRWKKWLGIKS